MSSSLFSLPLPSKKIYTDEDVNQFKHTSGYNLYNAFLLTLNTAIRGKREAKIASSLISESVKKLEELLLDEVEGWIKDIPPMDTPQRFGNLSFRKWGLRLEEKLEGILHTVLPSKLHSVIPHLTPYLVESFGNHTRMDYGTGHETAFMMFLCILAQIGYFDISSTNEHILDGDLVNDAIAIPLYLFPRYLRVTWALQDAYNLEPAGSHGVWGLDDSSFIGYIFGSSQMCLQDDYPPETILDFVKKANAAQKTKSLVDEPLILSLYHLMVRRILKIKSGPFHEHSSQLYNIASGVKTWRKVNEGMRKMYDAEVLSKRVVVQHIPLGGVLLWDPPRLSTDQPVSQGQVLSRPVNQEMSSTRAPWAQ
ncbi:hypothetical protein DL96DRAFT_153014 [Flagelloscypha sp. PMI_526]|nr:hypothetical protein DL96DRAFT_153014 [Flagelloscypha sp. PMI_526]